MKVYYVADDGTMTQMSCAYDHESKSVSVPTTYFSTFAIVYEQPAGIPAESGDDGFLMVCIAVMAVAIIALVAFIVVIYMKGYTRRF